MSVMQVWLVAGIPALVLAALLFVATSRLASLFAYVVLASGFAVVTSVDRASGAIFGALLALVYATGRGQTPDRRRQSEVMPDVVHDEGHGHVGG